MRKITALLIISALIIGCNTPKYTTDALPQKQLLFGEGGGFTGEVKEYILLENGQMFTRYNFGKVTEELSKTSKGKSKKMYARYKEIGLPDLDFIHPGNQYSFIQMNADSLSNHRVVWGDSRNELPAEVLKFFNELNLLVKPAKKK